MNVRIIASNIDITPTSPTVLGGRIGGVSSSGVSERLEANLVVLRNDADSDPIVVISLDLLYPGRILRAAIESALPELRPDQIFLTASHTHQAPMTDDTKLTLGTPNSEYMRTLAVNLSTEVKRVLDSDSTQFGIVSTSTLTANHSINRRRKRRFTLLRRPRCPWFTVRLGLARKFYVMAPNPVGVTDELVTTMISRSLTGQAQFVIWNYACHPVSFPDKDRIAAHFPHYVRSVLRASLGVENLPVLFLQGFSGNTRPSASIDHGAGSRSRVRSWLFGPSFGNMSWSVYSSWATELGKLVETGCATSTRLQDVGLLARRSVFPSSLFVEGAAEADVSFHAIRFGPSLAIVGVSAEVVAEFAPTVRAMTGSKQVMCVGCLDHPFGYAPTNEILHEGGYEGGDYCELFDLGPLVSSVEEAMLEGFRSVT